MNNSTIEKIHFISEALGKEMQLLVYLPDCYHDQDSFPVLYFFHGRSGDEQIMFDAEISQNADRMIADKEIKPMIIVCPRIENSRGINSSVECRGVKDLYYRTINLGMYEDYFIKEIIPLIDNRYKTIKDRTGRYIGGASAGGYAALHNGLRHQDLFSKIGGHMPALELNLEEEDKPYIENPSNWNRYDPIWIAKNDPIAQDMEFYLDAGNEDEGGFYEGCSVLQGEFEKKGITSQNHTFEGHHNVEYIRGNMSKYLYFYGGTL